MKDQLIELGQKMLKNIDRVAVVAFLLLLVAAGFFFFRERGYTPPGEPLRTATPFSVQIPAPPDYDPTKTVDEEGKPVEPPPYLKVMANVETPVTDINEDPVMRRLVVINMFDAQSVRESAEQAREIDRDLERARALFEQQSYEDALRVVESILRRNPNHRRTLELRRDIEAAMAAPAPEATPEISGEPETGDSTQ